MLDFYGHNRIELESFCQGHGLSPTHATRLYRGMYKKPGSEAWNIPGLPVDLAKLMRDEFHFEPVTVDKFYVSGYDGSVNFIYRLKDGERIESVLMPEKRRITICVSSQVGCAQACGFCYTGRMGLKRNLTASEIVGQIVQANRWIKENPQWFKDQAKTSAKKVSHVVFMGMGEPLDNVEALSQAILIMRDPLGLDLALRHISVSTSGHLDGLNVLLKNFPCIPVAVSLHAASDTKRSQLMPINRRWPLAQVVEAIRQMSTQHKNPILVQYTVINGVNDSLEEAEQLCKLLAGLSVKINLIPYNEIAPSRFQPPLPERLNAFRDFIHKQGIRVLIRYSKGQDIGAACGQLVQ